MLRIDELVEEQTCRLRCEELEEYILKKEESGNCTITWFVAADYCTYLASSRDVIDQARCRKTIVMIVTAEKSYILVSCSPDRTVPVLMMYQVPNLCYIVLMILTDLLIEEGSLKTIVYPPEHSYSDVNNECME